MTRLTKGQNTPLTATAIRATIGWQSGPGGPDVDASALLLGADRKVRSDADFIFYNQPSHPSGAVRHEGKSAGSDTVGIDVSKLPGDVERVLIGASADGGPFGKVPGLHLLVRDAASGAELARFDITDASSETAYLFGEVYKRGGAWKLRAVGQGYDSGLHGFATDFGVGVDEPAPAPSSVPAISTRRATAAPGQPQHAPPSAPAAPPSAPPAAPAAPYQAPAAPPTGPYQPPAAPPTGPYQPPQAPPTGPYPGQPPAAPYPPQAPPGQPTQGVPAQAQPGGQPAAAGGPVNLAKQRKLIDMEKRAAQQAPQLLNLTKQAAVSLEKRGLSDHTARVALCLDISGSMNGLYRSGKIQSLVERVLALGLRFDDNEAVDVFLFGADVHEVGELRMNNFQSFLGSVLQRHPLEGGTYYGKAMQAIRANYWGSPGPRNQPLRDNQPVYVMFVTDGATFDESVTIEQLKFSAFEPIFWQFMAIGDSPQAVDADRSGKRKGFLKRLMQSDFTFLENLDNLPGRYIDNANFFAVTDPAKVPDAQLFDLMMAEYPGWLQLARRAGLLP
jgi:stress response protein SCP2